MEIIDFRLSMGDEMNIKRTLTNVHVVDWVLSKEHHQIGLVLFEDDVFVYLGFRGQTVATWDSRTVVLAEIHKEADKYLGGDAVEALIKCRGMQIERV